MRNPALVFVLITSMSGTAAADDGVRTWILDRDRADHERGLVSLEVDPDSRGGEVTLYASDASMSIHAIKVVYPDRRVVHLNGRGGRRLELGLIGAPERIDVRYVNQRPSKDDTLTLAVQRDVDDESDEIYDERIFGGEYDLSLIHI